MKYPLDVLAGLSPAPLEDWYRKNYFTNEFDVSGSGVEDYTFGEILNITNASFATLNDMSIGDAPTIGSDEIRQKVATRFGDGDAEKVVITSGGNEALHLVVRALLNSGDTIITLGPCYHCHDKIAESMGCKVLKWPIPLDENGDISIHSLESILDSSIKAIFLNFPHNPTGRSISANLLEQIITLAKQHDIVIVWDAVFQDLVYESEKLTDPILSYEKAVSIGTFSKAYGSPGLRFGWLISNIDIVRSCARQKDYGNLFVPYLVEFIAGKMLDHLDAIYEPRMRQALANRAFVDTWLSDHFYGLSWVKPSGGVCGLVKLPDGVDDYDFCVQLLALQGVLFVPGSCFGCAGYVRLGFGGNGNKLRQAITRIDNYLKSSGLGRSNTSVAML